MRETVNCRYRVRARSSVRWCLTALLLAVAGCAASDPQPAQSASGPLLPSLQVYTSGDDVTFVLQVTNTTDAPLELNFSDGQMYDFVVTSGEREVWRWSEDMMFTQALHTDVVPAGESRRYEASWLPAAGERGEYSATGILTSTDHRVEQSTRLVLP
jgi:hypothetical protein